MILVKGFTCQRHGEWLKSSSRGSHMPVSMLNGCDFEKSFFVFHICIISVPDTHLWCSFHGKNLKSSGEIGLWRRITLIWLFKSLQVYSILYYSTMLNMSFNYYQLLELGLRTMNAVLDISLRSQGLQVRILFPLRSCLFSWFSASWLLIINIFLGVPLVVSGYLTSTVLLKWIIFCYG